jgi:hypothetical protein
MPCGVAEGPDSQSGRRRHQRAAPLNGTGRGVSGGLEMLTGCSFESLAVQTSRCIGSVGISSGIAPRQRALVARCVLGSARNATKYGDELPTTMADHSGFAAVPRGASCASLVLMSGPGHAPAGSGLALQGGCRRLMRCASREHLTRCQAQYEELIFSRWSRVCANRDSPSLTRESLHSEGPRHGRQDSHEPCWP